MYLCSSTRTYILIFIEATDRFLKAVLYMDYAEERLVVPRLNGPKI